MGYVSPTGLCLCGFYYHASLAVRARAFVQFSCTAARAACVGITSMMCIYYVVPSVRASSHPRAQRIGYDYGRCMCVVEKRDESHAMCVLKTQE